MPSVRLMAPWWRDYLKATDPQSRSGQNVSPKEVETLIKPHANVLKNDANYRAEITKLLSNEPGAPHATVRAEKPLRALLAATGAKYNFKATVLGASYSPGVGIMPADPPPGMIFGPHVNLRVQFPEGTAKAVAHAEMDHHARTLTIKGKRVHVDGTLTVFVHGESDQRTRIRTAPLDVDVPAPSLATPFGGPGPRYALVVRDDSPNGHGTPVLSMSTFEPGPLPV